MSNTVKLAAALPKDNDFNGLDAQASRLVERPDDLLIVVGWVDAQKVTIDTDSGDEVPTARLRRVEPICDVGEAPQVLIDLVQQAIQKRTGRKPVPFGIGSVEEKEADPQQASIDDELGDS
jgi:hypothetical protein